MDENLNIFNLPFDLVIQKKDYEKFPKLKNARQHSTGDRPIIKCMNKRKNHLNLVLLTNNKQKLSLNFGGKPFEIDTLTNINKIDEKFGTPKKKYLVSTLPTKSKSISSPKISTKKKIKNTIIDWKTSPLENLIILKRCEFNWEKDPSFFTSYQINNINPSGNGYVIKHCVENTICKLCNELVQNEYVIGKVSDWQLLEICKFYLKVREATVDLLENIHRREYLLLRLVTSNIEPGEISLSTIDESAKYKNCNNFNERVKLQEDFMKITFEIISKIKKWKKFNLSNREFHYSGQNYMKKIYNDLLMLEDSLIMN